MPAFLFETLFYLSSVFENTRLRFARASSAHAKAGLLWISALVPYLIFSLSTGTFQRNAFYVLALLAGALAFWHAILPRRLAYDIGFLVIAAAPFITRVFPRIYLSPNPHVLRIDILGHLMWIRVGLVAILVLREWDPGPVSLWPTRREWRTGALWFAIGIIPIALVSLLVHDTRLQLHAGPWWLLLALAVGTFFGFLWVVALGEELFFRGVIERGLLKSWRSPVAAVLVSSLLFGAAHLWFRPFPDGRRATVALILGIFCGLACLKSGSIRASMVTHSLVVVTWRILFK
ncbi:MAG: CPBP family intramembrane metalloprotease [Acidobacteriota bacterium]|nr:CPBP family intramembrane metalloprotease [Acidobacteriota bacterium]